MYEREQMQFYHVDNVSKHTVVHTLGLVMLLKGRVRKKSRQIQLFMVEPTVLLLY